MSKKLPKTTVATLDEIRHQTRDEPPPPPSLPASPDPAPATDMAIALRRSQAREVVERYTTYAAVGGLIPLPLDSLSVMAIIALMIQAVATIYGVSLGRDRARILAASLAGGLGQAGVGSATTASLAKMLPGANLVGLMMSSAAAAALTRTAGRAFILHFETGGTALQGDAEAIRAYFAASLASQPISRQ